MGPVFLEFVDDEAIKFNPMGVVNFMIFRRRLGYKFYEYIFRVDGVA